VQLFAGFTDNKPVVIGSSENINRFMCEYKPSWLVYFNIYTSKVFQWLNPACLKKIWHSLIPCDDVIVIDNLKNLKHDFSSLLLYFKAHSCENVTDPVTFFQKMSYKGHILFRVRFHSNFF